MEPLWIILAPLTASLAAPAIVRAFGPGRAGAALSFAPLAIAALLLRDAWAAGAPAIWTHPWLPALGVELALKVGGFERLFLFLVSFIGGLVCIYGGAYLDGDAKASRFFVVVMVFMAAMLGVIAADDLILTFVFWELTSLTSFLLVGYKFYDAAARKAALQALLVTGAGGPHPATHELKRPMTLLIEIACLAGSLAVFLAALGVVRFPDFFSRAHAATKASAFGLGLLLLSHVLVFPETNVILKSIFALVALFLTLPVATQALADAVRRKEQGPS